MQSYFSFIVKNKKNILCFYLVALIASIIQIGKLNVNVDNESLLPPDNKIVLDSRKIKSTFGLENSLVIGVYRDNGLVDESLFSAVNLITKELEAVPGVIRENILGPFSSKSKVIDSSNDGISVYSLSPRQAPAAIVSALESEDIFKGTLISHDKKMLLISAQFKESKEGHLKTMEKIESVLNKHTVDGIQYVCSGFVKYMSETERLSGLIAIYVLIAIVVIALILKVFYGSKQAMILPLLAGILTVIFVLGIMGSLKIPLDAFNATTPILVLAIVVGHSVQLLNAYYERIGNRTPSRMENDEAIVSSASSMAPILFSAAIAAAIGFFSLSLYSVASIKTFGIMSGAAILIGLLLEISFIPALRSTLTFNPSTRTSTAIHFTREKFHRIAQAINKRPGGVIFGYSLLVIALAISSYQLNISNSNKDNFAQYTKIRKDDAVLNAASAGTNLLYIMIDTHKEDGILDIDTLKSIKKIQDEISVNPVVGKSISISDHIERIHQSANGEAGSERALPESTDAAKQMMFLYGMSSSMNDFSFFIDDKRSAANIVVFLKNDYTAEALSLADNVTKISKGIFPASYDVTFGGAVLEGAAINDEIVHGKIRNIVQVILIIVLVSAFIFRSFLAGLFVGLPIATAAISVFGIMSLLDLKLGIATSLCAAIAVGIGADFGVYFLYRIRSEYKKTAQWSDSVIGAMSTAGTTCFIVALTIAAGYSILLLGYGFNPHRWMGELILIAVTLNVFVTLFVISALVLICKPKFLSRDSKQALE